MTKKPDKIYYTTDPSIFSKHPSNRPVDITTQQRKDLKNSILKYGILQPLLVDSSLRTIDGQHRIAICKEIIAEGLAPIDIPYIPDSSTGDVEEDNATATDKMKDLNISAKTWNSSDYVNFYAATNENYKKLHTLCTKFGANENAVVGLLTGKFNNATTRNSDFKKGELSVHPDAWGVVTDFLIFLEKFASRKLTTDEIYALFKFWTLAAVDQKRLLTVSSKILENWKTVPSTRFELETVIFDCYNFKLSKGKTINAYCIPNTFSGNKRSFIIKVRGKKALSRYPHLTMYAYYVDDEDE